MSKLVTIVGASGVGKTSLLAALNKAAGFAVALEQHRERPFQALFKQDKRYALANQFDYLLLRAEQERDLRASRKIGLMDGGLDLDFHGFTRLFHARGLLADPEYHLCRRLYYTLRSLLPSPDLVIHLTASEEVITSRLAVRTRINIASQADTGLLNTYIEEWLETLPASQVLALDVSHELPGYSRSVAKILDRISNFHG